MATIIKLQDIKTIVKTIRCSSGYERRLYSI